MSSIYKIGPVHSIDGAMPENVYAVRVSDLGSYGASPQDAVRAYATEQGASYLGALAFDGEDFAFLQFPK